MLLAARFAHWLRLYTIHFRWTSLLFYFEVNMDSVWLVLSPPPPPLLLHSKQQQNNKINIMTYGLQQINGITLFFVSLLRGTLSALPQMYKQMNTNMHNNDNKSLTVQLRLNGLWHIKANCNVPIVVIRRETFLRPRLLYHTSLSWFTDPWKYQTNQNKNENYKKLFSL